MLLFFLNVPQATAQLRQQTGIELGETFPRRMKKDTNYVEFFPRSFSEDYTASFLRLLVLRSSKNSPIDVRRRRASRTLPPSPKLSPPARFPLSRTSSYTLSVDGGCSHEARNRAARRNNCTTRRRAAPSAKQLHGRMHCSGVVFEGNGQEIKARRTFYPSVPRRNCGPSTAG